MIGASDLLRKLASGVRPDAGEPVTTHGAIEGDRFEALLSRIHSGELASGRAVRLDAPSDIELDYEMMSRLARVTDAAQAAGAERLLAWVDGRLLKVDVETRQAVEVGDSSDEILTGFDAAVMLVRESPEAARILPTPAALRSASLADVLARGVRSEAVAADERAAG